MKLIVRNNIPAAPALSTPPSPIETGLQARITALEQVQTEITTQAERGWGRGPGWVLLALMILFLAGTVTFGLLYGFTPSKSEFAALKSAAANAEIVADKARVEAGKVNAELLTKDAQLATAKTATEQAIAAKTAADKAAAEAKTAADNAITELTALKKAKSDADAKALADAAAAEKAAMLAKLAELTRKLEEKAAMPTPQANPAQASASTPATGNGGGDVWTIRGPAPVKSGRLDYKQVLLDLAQASKTKNPGKSDALAYETAATGTLDEPLKGFLKRQLESSEVSEDAKNAIKWAIGGRQISKADGKPFIPSATPGN